MNWMPIRVCALFLFICSCHKKNNPTLFNLIENCGINFENNITEKKEFNVFKYRNFYNGGGVAAGDLNNDGLPEVFFTANEGPNKLYLNKGNFKFQDISVTAGFGEKKQWSTGVVFADINNDGWLDIYVCNAGNMFEPGLRKNQLFINNHNLTFTESASEYGLDNDGYTTQASFFDYDMDGDLDCFMVNNSPIPVNTLNYAGSLRDIPDSLIQIADFLKGGGDHLYRNDKGTYKEVTRQAGIHGGLISLGLGVSVSDINNDGYPDIYVSNDFFEKDYLYINQRDGTFKDEMESSIQHTSLSSMGADIQDINNDGLADIFTTDMLPDDDYRLKANTSFENYDVYKLREKQGFYKQFTQNTLQLNSHNGKFLETGFYSGVAASDWSWGALIFDADNDGLNDIYVCNGIYRDVTDQDFIDFFGNEVIQQMALTGKKEDIDVVIGKMPSNPIANKMYRNNGDLKFTESGNQWGLSHPSFSNGAAYADLDNDGDLDLLVNNVNQKAFVYRNNSNGSNGFLSVSLKYKPLNIFGVGTKIKLYAGNQVLIREVMPSRGFQSGIDYKQIIGLGKTQPDSLVVEWPDGSSAAIEKPAINNHYLIDYSSIVNRKSVTGNLKNERFFEQQTSFFEKHMEDDFVDFYFERNIPFMISRLGPRAAVADVNGDGMEDIFIGGARNQASQLYLQTNNGFVKKDNPDFKTYSFNDVTAAFFFDCDKDGDMDLFSGGGGNFNNETTEGYQNLIYLNDGKGNFALKRGALPPVNMNCGTALPIDYNGDGNDDLFIGFRSISQNYGPSPRHLIFKNDGKGNFADVSEAVGKTLWATGMITAAAYEDINGDNKKDLIIAGDWISPKVFSFNGKKFVEIKTGLNSFYGWWQSIAVEDFDRDGDKDLLLGNMGNNFYLLPTDKTPVKLWMKDFDQNGTTDKILTRTVNGNDMPVFTKREITEQIPSLKKLNLKHHDYASKTIQQLFGDDLKNALIKNVNYSSSCIAYNNGKGQFTVKELPNMAQLSSINAFKTMDINNDGYPDVLAAGNCVNMLPQFCRVDASYGQVMINDKKGGFVLMPYGLSGIEVTGETRDITSIKTKNGTFLVFLQNDDVPLVFKMKTK